jgi:hypothetical protein
MCTRKRGARIGSTQADIKPEKAGELLGEQMGILHNPPTAILAGHGAD